MAYCTLAYTHTCTFIYDDVFNIVLFKQRNCMAIHCSIPTTDSLVSGMVYYNMHVLVHVLSHLKVTIVYKY